MPTIPTRLPTLALMLALVLATILISALPADASGPFARKGPYLALAPYTQAIHLDMEYTLADFETHISSSEWRAFWRAGAGWAFSDHFALGLEIGATGESLYYDNHEYSIKLLRANWFPTGGSWYLSGGGGLGSANAPLKWSPGHESGLVYDESFVVTLGAGYEIPVWRNLALQLQADWLQQRAHSHEGQSGYRFDIDSWTVGVMLIWYP